MPTMGNLSVAFSLRCPQHQLGSSHQSVRQGAGTGQASQLGLFVNGKGDGGHGAAGSPERSLPQNRLVLYSYLRDSTLGAPTTIADSNIQIACPLFVHLRGQIAPILAYSAQASTNRGK